MLNFTITHAKCACNVKKTTKKLPFDIVESTFPHEVFKKSWKTLTKWGAKKCDVGGENVQTGLTWAQNKL